MEENISFYRALYALVSFQSTLSYPHIYENEIPDTINAICATLLYTISFVLVLPRHLVSASISSSFNLVDIGLLLSLEVSRDDAATSLAAEVVLGNNVLDTHDMAAMSEPMEEGVAKDIDESNEWDNVGDTCASSVGDRALDRGEDCSTRNTLDHDTSTATCVHSEVLCPQGKQ